VASPTRVPLALKEDLEGDQRVDLKDADIVQAAVARPARDRDLLAMTVRTSSIRPEPPNSLMAWRTGRMYRANCEAGFSFSMWSRFVLLSV
jgi:hypothetical protein